jgi:iron complex outermembrane receptor protein
MSFLAPDVCPNRALSSCLTGILLLLWVGGAGIPAAQAQGDGTLQGRVLERGADVPVPQANVILRRDGDTWGASTDSTGRFSISAPAGAYRLEWTAVGYTGGARPLSLDAGGTDEVTLRLAPAEYTLNEIVVEGQGGAPAQSVSTVQRLDPASIRRQDAADVSELAALLPATHVQTNSRGQTILYFRNAGDRQVGQFFDGALLNIPWDNRVNISLIPASVVEEVTVTKGVPSVRYGANVLGGAINFQSRTLDAPGQTTELTGALGTYGQRRASVTRLQRTENWDVTTAVQYSGHGDQPLPGDANLANNQPSTDRRTNTDRKMLSGFGRVSHRFDNGGTFGVSVLHVNAEQGVAPEGNAPDDQSRYWRYPLWQKSTLIASGQTPLGPNTSLRGAAWGSRFARDIADYESVAYTRRASTQEGRDWTTGARLIATHRLPIGDLSLALNGLSSQHEKTLLPSDGPDSTSVYQQHIFSAGLEYEAQPHPRLEVRVGGSVDGTAAPETGPFPPRDPFYAWGLTSGLRVDLGSGWGLRGAAGRKSRFPTMRELFGAALEKFVPNPGLTPVTAWIGEVGLEHQSDAWSVGATGFYNRVYNTIGKETFTPEIIDDRGLPQRYLRKEQRINLAGARIYGVETTGRWQATEALLLDGTVSWSRPRGFTETGTQKLDEKPAWLGTGTAVYETGLGLSLMAQGRYIGRVFARNENNRFVQLPSSVVLDARVSYDLTPMLGGTASSLYVRASNVTDDARFVGLGLPGPGRSFRAGVEITL